MRSQNLHYKDAFNQKEPLQREILTKKAPRSGIEYHPLNGSHEPSDY